MILILKVSIVIHCDVRRFSSSTLLFELSVSSNFSGRQIYFYLLSFTVSYRSSTSLHKIILLVILTFENLADYTV
jgi:hypothetical protein